MMSAEPPGYLSVTLRAILAAHVILLVDDQPELCDLLQRLCRSWGFASQCAYDAETAMQLIRASLPSLVILDDNMPDMTGLDLLQSIRAEPALAQVPVVMFSAGVLEERKQEAMRLGALAWLTKSHGFDVLRGYARTCEARQLNDLT
jgi:DNA-binding response OmpR family regulator